MPEDKYQIAEKARYIRLLLLQDELEYFDSILSEPIGDHESLLNKLRMTRFVFLSLSNLKDAADRTRVEADRSFFQETRILRKTLSFANHFRNRAIGHLDEALLERAAQWSPEIFLASAENDAAYQTLMAQRSIIESSINSFLDQTGRQKTFGTEIDLFYPPDAKQFFSYLSDVVNMGIRWLSGATSILRQSIHHHEEGEMRELGAIAGQTNFSLGEESDLTFCPEDLRDKETEVLQAMEAMNVPPELLALLRKMLSPS